MTLGPFEIFILFFVTLGPLKLIGARSCRLGLSRVASDHLPIIAEFELS